MPDIQYQSFAEFFHVRRRKTGLTLRKFCVKFGLDHVNISKLEQGILPAPRDLEKIKIYAKALDIEEDSEEWRKFFDLAAKSARSFPINSIVDARIIEGMPVIFRYKGEHRALLDLAEAIREEMGGMH